MLKKLLMSATVLLASVQMASAADLGSMSWDEIVAQAKEEGELTWYVWYFQDDFRREVKAFEEAYGIEVTIPVTTLDGNTEKLLAERDRDTGDIDAFAWDWDLLSTVKPASLFYSLDMLPEDEGRVSTLSGYDSKGYAFAFWGNQTGIAYDPAKIEAEDLPQSVDDFAAYWQANPNKFGFNYENGGSGPSFYQNVLRVVSGADFTDGSDSDEHLAELQPGIDFFNKYAEDYVITVSNADSITRVSDGELTMAPAWEDHLAGLQKRGEVRKELKFYIPEMGMNGGGNAIAIPRNAPHPAAAAVFVNWLTSAETQSKLNRNFGSAPMNAAADDSYALVPNEQRQYRMPWGAQPFRGKVEIDFIENVVQER
ncbi:putative spermidine/putrescine transport system substrate-binding protein [Cohaesibacter sp. ES.047]|uniref:ABC transporter substrate-binding protein n=1 Tax=Cohaesibacter sp. ES.047 TaxID=1798205 RepID=UPI000BB95624|nr:extracellular solute-binding protein [Cohaesibacter sp. ES.047]SNY91664.1 putative spermidine/putrescine transport system substrate-binding protein [Cohaesibacter sp. ES.047]